ncbi:hypothetical protein [Microbispora rosea]|uniref:hypothetical protein n=1 Tax=Microbispora rosea TaxID=58117 RepID=UPI003D91E5E3
MPSTLENHPYGENGKICPGTAPWSCRVHMPGRTAGYRKCLAGATPTRTPARRFGLRTVNRAAYG